MKNSKFINEEMHHHDKEASEYAKRGEKDYIWEVPTKLFLFKNEYFLPRKVIIDFGCGPSILIKHIIPITLMKHLSYTGVDISKNMLTIAKRNVPTGKFIQGDMESVKFKRNYADIIISLGALHHSQNQYKTIDSWVQILKNDGKLLLREPLYEALHRGQGESPNEEGIKIKQLVKHLQEKNMEIKTLVFFTSPAFHLFNRILIKIGLGGWQEKRILWYPVIVMDVYLDRILGRYIPFFHGLAFAMEVIKNENTI